jgi:hypothetical protein
MSEATKKPSSNPLESGASAVIAEAFAAMRRDDRAKIVADALEHAWAGGDLHVERAVREIETPTAANEGPRP